MIYLALDIGGTEIKYGLINENGDILDYYKKDTKSCKGYQYLISNIKEIINFLIDKCKTMKENIKAIGISTAGQVNSNEGEIIFATEAIPGWTGVKLKKIIEHEFNYPCYVDNDVNCAALGEMWCGAAKKEKNFLCLTLGTGIGGAIVFNGMVLKGSSFSAGEFGHMNLYPQGIKCSCGQTGCFERYASTLALVERGREILKSIDADNKDIEKLNGKIIFEKAKCGQKLYINLLDEWTYDIALGLKSLVHIFNPSLIIIGGGVSAQKQYLINLIKKHLDKMVMPSFIKTLNIKTAECGNLAGILGAVYGCKMNLDIM